ncbi:MAG: phosphoglucosamine mutase [Alphaproteobacteria bacterium]|nr:phosphoglucosamine mutase [Alphaproteobacteria bacterium]
MARRLFGTDGIRGTANTVPMTADIALRVGMATGRLFTRGDHRHRVVIGKDTRLSGYLFESALTAGFVSVGMDCILVGPMPTPAIAMLTRSMRADLGVMISASHNPYQDNGIKLFGPDGFKLSDDVETAIESLMNDRDAIPLAGPRDLGRAKRLDDADGRYIEFAKSTFPKSLTLDGLRIVLDCANGAAYRVAPTVLWELGAEVIPIGVTPDGFNINQRCGSTHPSTLSEAVVTHGADLGIALDGDADRLIVCDEHGAIIDGDQLMAMIAEYWHSADKLKGGGVVATVMSNLGLERFLGGLGLTLTRTKVGDRYVVEAMRAGGFNVGGEQSGHIILADHATTGDGMIAALQYLAVLSACKGTVSQCSRRFDTLPQILKNIPFSGTNPLDDARVRRAIADAEARLGRTGRVVVRPSGTEPVIRIMVEAENSGVMDAVVAEITDAVARTAKLSA